MEHLSIFPYIAPPVSPFEAQEAAPPPLYINRPIVTDEDIERALQQELGG